MMSDNMEMLPNGMTMEDYLASVVPNLSKEELERREAAAIAEVNQPTMDEVGEVVSIDAVENSDIILYTTETGHKTTLTCLEAYDRAWRILDMLNNAPGSFGKDNMDKAVWLCVETMKACVKSLRGRGVDISGHKAVKEFEKKLLKVEKDFKNVALYKKGKKVAMYDPVVGTATKTGIKGDIREVRD